ncbi:MAG TPA: hypothetical protein VFI24_01085 [Pyrinomonadaceae bacterium]|nr:hypothetical protein [Pyrinomonadaceae bacterium]
MPKDPAKNVDRYKIRGGVINEYEYHENQQALAEDEPQKGAKKTVTKKAAKRATGNEIRGASAKTLAARKAARK